MNIYKCDICSKIIEQRTEIAEVCYGDQARHIFCLECAMPIGKFLHDKQMLPIIQVN